MTSIRKKTGAVTLEGELTIFRAPEILSLLKKSLQANKEVRITLQDVSTLDLSCLQILCSTHRTATAAGKMVILEAPLPDLFRKLIQQSGFKRRKGCTFSPNTNCLCFDGGEKWEKQS